MFLTAESREALLPCQSDLCVQNFGTVLINSTSRVRSPKSLALLSFRLSLDINDIVVVQWAPCDFVLFLGQMLCSITLTMQCMVKDGVLEAQFVNTNTTELAVCFN